MCFTGNLANIPDNSEVEVFRKSVAKLISFQKQLDLGYHEETFLEDKYMTAIVVTSIQILLLDRISCTAQQVINHILNRFSGKPKMAGSAHMNYKPD